MKQTTINDDHKNNTYSEKEILNYTIMLKNMVEKHPLSFFTIIKSKKHENEYGELKKFIFHQTRFIDFDCNFGTRCKYVIDKQYELYKCHVCGKPIRKNIFATNRQTKFWCSSQCLAKDNEINQQIGQKISLASKGKKVIASNNLPKECKIIYHDSPIEYDDELNKQIYELFLNHQKTFKFWLMKEQMLYEYFMKSTYPIDFTNLGIGTRLYWLTHKFQKFPRCMTCGRQLDFKDIKMSHKWPITCCRKCNIEYVAKLTEIRHRNDMYDRMLNQNEIEPLYSRDFYMNAGTSYDNFKVKCKKCGYVFHSAINLNWFRRSKSSNLFRCPYCHPSVKYRSKVEKDVFNYIKNDLNYIDALHSYHEIIKPYELDIYIPSKKTAIEFNGILWHSLENEITIDYHLNKTIKCENAGIKLIHIWEDEWHNNPTYIKLFIKNILNDSQPIIIINENNKKLIDRSQFNKISVDCSSSFNMLSSSL